ncbi:unnamed protein product [Callosobruchus maculatus]|uniref:Uncharacterized protein n=1 Tax=Callosobruchus maculatus TaxID=64391 RepID=A0A653BNX6_CALMS|nr:unnamed protein product [Callosobruchus maculatus]
MVTSKSLIPSAKSRSKTLKHQRSNSLTEINDTIFNIAVKDPSQHKMKLPSLGCRPLQKRKVFLNTTSLDNLPEETEPVDQPKPEFATRSVLLKSPRNIQSQTGCLIGLQANRHCRNACCWSLRIWKRSSTTGISWKTPRRCF